MSTENQVIVIVQNFYAWVTSSIGFLLLIPFYQVRVICVKEANYFTLSLTTFQPRDTGRGFSVEDSAFATSQSPWLSPGAVENIAKHEDRGDFLALIHRNNVREEQVISDTLQKFWSRNVGTAPFRLVDFQLDLPGEVVSELSEDVP